MNIDWPWSEELGRRVCQAVELEKLVHPQESDRELAHRILTENRSAAIASLRLLSEHAINAEIRQGARDVLKRAEE